MKEKRKNEIAGVAALTGAIFIFLALLTYDPYDPSFTVSTKEPTHNLIGLTGAWLSDILFTLGGVASFLLPVYLFLYGFRKFRPVQENESRFFNKWIAAGTAVLLLSLPASLNLILPESISWTGKPILIHETGGFLGKMETALFLHYFGKVGSYLVAFSGLLLSVMILTHFSPGAAAGGLSGRLSAFFSGIKALAIASVKKTRSLKENAKKAGKDLLPRPKPKIVEPQSAMEAEIKEKQRPPRQEGLPFPPTPGNYQLPPLTLLDNPPASMEKMSPEELQANSELLRRKLLDFGIEGNVSEVHPGPVITLYEFEPAPGIKVNKITNLAEDLALAMKAIRVRIVGPIPGKATVGIEIPNRIRETVSLRHLIGSGPLTQKLPLFLGKDISGHPVTADFIDMPHLLVAGATGSGKSVSLNAMILSLLFTTRPDDLKMMMIDPKMLELTVYNDIPHLIRPVITQPKEAAKGLQEAAMEMQRRYKVLAEAGVRNIEGYRKLAPRKRTEKEEAKAEHMPYLVIIIDELADLIMTSQREVEDAICRLAQMGRAAGIHLLLATQRPSVDVLTGVIKANFPARISFQVSSKTDSRTILDANGAEQLLGKGDMLFLVPGTGRMSRIHGPFVTEEEIQKVASFLKQQGKPDYDAFRLPSLPEPGFGPGGGDERDSLYEQATEIVITSGQASASLIQRRLKVGYPRAARMIEMMAEDGIVSPPGSGKQREVLVRREMED